MDRNLQAQIENTQAELKRLQILLEEQKRQANILKVRSGEMIFINHAPYIVAIVDNPKGISLQFISLRDGQRWAGATPIDDCRLSGYPLRYDLDKMGNARGSVPANQIGRTGKTVKEYYANI